MYILSNLFLIFFSLSHCTYDVRCVLWLDKQKIENETKKKTERNSTVEVLEEQLILWTTKVKAMYKCSIRSGKYVIHSELVQYYIISFFSYFLFQPFSCLPSELLWFTYQHFHRLNELSKFSMETKKHWKRCWLALKSYSGA